jgi:hypothetical protein
MLFIPYYEKEIKERISDEKLVITRGGFTYIQRE